MRDHFERQITQEIEQELEKAMAMNASYIGGQFALGQAEKPRSAFDALSEARDWARKAADEVAALAERLCGSRPENEAHGNNALRTPGGLIDRVSDDARSIRLAIEDILRDLNRINGRL